MGRETEEVEVEVGDPRRRKHCASLFSYLCIPFLTSVSLGFKITPLQPHTSPLSLFLPLFFHSFSRPFLHNHLVWHFPAATNDAPTANVNALSVRGQREGELSGGSESIINRRHVHLRLYVSRRVCVCVPFCVRACKCVSNSGRACVGAEGGGRGGGGVLVAVWKL